MEHRHQLPGGEFARIARRSCGRTPPARDAGRRAGSGAGPGTPRRSPRHRREVSGNSDVDSSSSAAARSTLARRGGEAGTERDESGEAERRGPRDRAKESAIPSAGAAADSLDRPQALQGRIRRGGAESGGCSTGGRTRGSPGSWCADVASRSRRRAARPGPDRRAGARARSASRDPALDQPGGRGEPRDATADDQGRGTSGRPSAPGDTRMAYRQTIAAGAPLPSALHRRQAFEISVSRRLPLRAPTPDAELSVE